MTKTAGQLMAEAAKELGFELVLANSGTTEVQFVGAFVPVFGDKFVLCLHEDVCTGAADGYARITEKPALVNLHLGPGLAHGLSNIHNARRAESPIVVIIGDHDVAHRDADAPLTSDIEALAKPFCQWVRTTKDPRYIARDLADALYGALYPKPGISALVVPNDILARPVDDPKRATFSRSAAPPADDKAIGLAVDQLKRARNPLVIVGGRTTGEAGQRAAWRIARATGGSVASETFPPVLARGGDIPPIKRLSYPGPVARKELEPHDLIFLAGVSDLTPFFSDNVDRTLLRTGERTVLVADLAPALPGAIGLWGDPLKTLSVIADELGGDFPVVGPSRSEMGGSSVGRAIADGLTEGAIVVDEAITNTLGLYAALEAAPRHDYLTIKGGSLGAGIPVGLGAALADADRKVVVAVGDGTACYTIQALWNIARLGADVTIVVFNNGNYDIIAYELARAGFTPPPKQAVRLDPKINFALLAEGQGLTALRLESPDEAAITEAVAAKEPILVDIAVPSMFPA
ncbi:MAG: acetolactate synthase large subunit [Acidimicrobiia bacterium]